jgi:hypothetical protein
VAVEVVAERRGGRVCGRLVMGGVWKFLNPGVDLSWVGKNQTRVVLPQPRSCFGQEAETCGFGV